MMCWFWIAAQKLNLRFCVNGWKMHPVMSVQLLCLQSVVRRWDWGRGRDRDRHEERLQILQICEGRCFQIFRSWGFTTTTARGTLLPQQHQICLNPILTRCCVGRSQIAQKLASGQSVYWKTLRNSDMEVNPIVPSFYWRSRWFE